MVLKKNIKGGKVMSSSEKVTVNVNVVDLGQIDLLVKEGFYSNRTDFIKTSIRNQLKTHDLSLREVIVRKTYSLGIVVYNRKSLEEYLVKGIKIDIKVVGMLVLKDDIPTELAIKTINSIDVSGIFKCNDELKEALSNVIM